MTTCNGCGLEIDRAKGYARFSYGWGASPLEQLQSYRALEYCGACAKAIRKALNIAEPGAIPDPPFACADPRLELHAD